MKLDELEKLKASDDEVEDGEFCEAGADGDEDSLEADLTQALDYLDSLVTLVEQVVVHRGKVVRIPRGLTELMEDITDFLDKWDTVEEMRSDKVN